MALPKVAELKGVSVNLFTMSLLELFTLHAGLTIAVYD
jgi:hypothetical protein